MKDCKTSYFLQDHDRDKWKTLLPNTPVSSFLPVPLGNVKNENYVKQEENHKQEKELHIPHLSSPSRREIWNQKAVR